MSNQDLTRSPQMRSILLTVMTLTLVITPAVASQDGVIVMKSIETYQQIEAVRHEMREAVGELSDEKRAYELAVLRT